MVEEGMEARGEFVPLLLTEDDEGGPGVLRLTSAGPVFVTDGGWSHDFGWDGFVHYEHDEATGEFVMQTAPGNGAKVYVHPDDPDAWTSALSARLPRK